MTPSQIVVPSAVGAQGESIENFVLDRVSGDVEKNLGQVIENALDGSSIPVAALIVLDGASQIRRAYIADAAALIGDLGDAVEVDRETAIGGLLNLVLSEPETAMVKLELADPSSTLKSKLWEVDGLTQEATISGTSGHALVDALFVPSKKSYTLAGLIAKLEDLALTSNAVAIYVDQNFPAVYFVATGATPAEFDPAAVTANFHAAPLAQINGVFIAGSADSNPSFGFESGGGF